MSFYRGKPGKREKTSSTSECSGSEQISGGFKAFGNMSNQCDIIPFNRCEISLNFPSFLSTILNN